MPRFFVIDPWLANAKGHNYQYALDLAQAAQDRGYEPILGVRQSLDRQVEFPAGCRVERVFRHGECPRHWVSLDARSVHPCDLEGRWLPDTAIRWWQRCLDLPAGWDRRRRIRSFGEGCRRLFQAVAPASQDVLYLPSLSDFDFLSAVRFWRDHPWTQDFDWHLQFHFNFYTGRDPEFADQAEMLQRMQRMFRAAVDQIPRHRLHFYTTTAAIARQYDALGIAIFRPLPYPVRALSPAEPVELPERPARPLRVTLPGAMRREKGKKRIGSLIDTTWDELLEPGRVQFQFQAAPGEIRRWLPARIRPPARIGTAASPEEAAPFLAAPHPLSTEQYEALIRSSDIGLFIYDARRYFSRVSGILCEMLSAGVPVIVPAGCWLAEQVAEENYRYLDQQWRQQREESPTEASAVTAQLSGSRTTVSFTSPVESALVRFAWPKQVPSGTFAELTVQPWPTAADQHAKHARPVRGERAILTGRESGFVLAAVQDLPAALSWEITLRNAYATTALDISTVEVLPLSGPASVRPGSIGLIASDERDYPRQLQELVAHYEHYARSARRFARQWQWRHAPANTVAELESRSAVSEQARHLHAA